MSYACPRCPLGDAAIDPAFLKMNAFFGVIAAAACVILGCHDRDERVAVRDLLAAAATCDRASSDYCKFVTATGPRVHGET